MTVAVVDFGMGNLFSVQQALARAGLESVLTDDPVVIDRASAVVLPGMGAFGDAMAELHRRGLVEPVRRAAKSNKPFLGICLGLQLLFEESAEFGRHEGLGVIRGKVVRFESPVQDGVPLKVPHVGWTAIYTPQSKPTAWDETPLAGIPEGTRAYFVHSFYAVPSAASVVVAVSRYGQLEYASAVNHQNVFACQFHPEKSGAPGIEIYSNFGKSIR